VQEYAEKCAEDQGVFFADYSAAHKKLSELGSKFEPPEVRGMAIVTAWHRVTVGGLLSATVGARGVQVQPPEVGAQPQPGAVSLSRAFSVSLWGPVGSRYPPRFLASTNAACC